jgi:hypothetical protein
MYIMKTRNLTTLLLATALTGTMATAALAADANQGVDLTKPIVSKGTPRNSDGHADLTGTWTNVSITPLQRPSSFGTRKALTKEEAGHLEGDAVQHFVDGNKPTDPNSGSEGGKKCADAGGLDCGYNTGWKDSGTTVVRVNGEPRSSFITFPADGRRRRVSPAVKAKKARRQPGRLPPRVRRRLRPAVVAVSTTTLRTTRPANAA